jgi:hypothetical protein
MRNPFAQPHTPGQWLLSSLCWAAACLICWAGLTYCIADLPYEHRSLQPTLLLFSFVPIYSLVWKKTVLSPVLTTASLSVINCFVIMWIIILITMQIAWPFFEFFLLAFSGLPTSNN